MSESAYWRAAKNLDWHEFSMHNLSIDKHRFEITKLVHALSLLVFTAKEKYALERRLVGACSYTLAFFKTTNYS